MQYTSYQFQHQHKFVYLSWPCALCKVREEEYHKKIGEDKKYTSQKQQTNSPYWNEVFVFEYNQSKDIVFDKIVKQVLHFLNALRKRFNAIPMTTCSVGFEF